MKGYETEEEFSAEPTVMLKKGEGRTIKSGGVWVFDDEIARMEGPVQDGGIVRVLDFDGYPMGRGFINRASRIRVRMLTRNPEQQITREFLKQRVRDAWEYRKNVIDTSSCRVIFGEADYLPGLVVDKYSDVLVVQSLALGIDRLKKEILTDLCEILAEDGTPVRGIYERSDAAVRRKEGMEPVKGFIGEPFDTKVPITENGVQYLVDVENGQKTGFFLDQKLNRLSVQKLSRGKTVLDCFTHTGSFALNAAVGGAVFVRGYDISETAVEQARENARLNHVSDRVTFETADVLDLLPKLVEARQQYDFVILDPPAFTKSRDTIRQAARGYREINTCGLKLVKDGGYFATCSCSHFMDPASFSKILVESARKAHKALRQIEFKTQAPDHPILWNDDESYYLKFYIFQAVNSRS